ncbi:MAG TPA: hypothetical protein VFW94_03460, partial [Candidatus Acidoferrales bacterium]|nr:hypothetical protein [Candidatus Acidoferrales bacterium]
MRTDEPRAVHLKDYHTPDFHVSKIDLDFVLEPDAARVAAKMQVKRTGSKSAPLVLNGEQLKLLGLRIDNQELSGAHFRIDDETLTIEIVPDEFTLDVFTEIAPASNTSLEGLYLSKGIFCTQCEPEGF